MFRSTSSGSSNGYHYDGDGGHHVSGRRGRRLSRGRSRAHGNGNGNGNAESGARVSHWQQQDEGERPTPPCTDFDKAYFHSYAHVGIHEEMIKDRARTDGYRNAIFQHQNYIAGKVVVDVGCGTGILSIFCAQAGARRVYAVDASDIAVQANEVVKANNLSDTIIVLHGRVEDVEIDEEVDVIVSEWMGYMLLYESMLGSVITARDRWLKPGGLILPSNATEGWFENMVISSSVITARDRWLKPGGLILPSNATLYMAPVTHPDRYNASIDFWRNVYGIDMSAIMPLAKQCAFEEPSVETITGENVLTWPHVVKHVDCNTVTVHELECVNTSFSFKSMMRAPFHGFAFWFDVEFSGPAIFPSNIEVPSSFVEHSNSHNTDDKQRKKRANPNDALVLSTAPEDPPTHWQQTLIYFYDPIDVEQDQVIEGSLELSQSKENARFMNIHLKYSADGRLFVKESVMR